MPELIYRAARQSQADPFEYVMSDETVDRMGEVIKADGWDLAAFKTNPIGLFNHNSDAIIGRWEKVRVEGRKLMARFVFAEEGTSELVDSTRKLWDQKILRGASVGFRALRKEPLDEDADTLRGPFRYLSQQLLECSLVSVPANPNALPVLRSYHLLPEISRQIFGKPASQDRPVSRVPASPPDGGKHMSLSKRIEAAQRELNEYRDRLAELSKIEEPDEEQQALIDELQDNQIPATQAAIERMEKMEKTLGIKAAEPEVDKVLEGQIIPPDRKTFAVGKKKPEPGDYVYRALAAWTTAQVTKESPEKALLDRYGRDETTSMVLRTAVNPALTSVAGWAQELTSAVNIGFMDRLLPDFIYPRLSGRPAASRYTFGNNTQIKIPTRTTTSTLAGAWVGEGGAKPVKKGSFSTVTLTPFKLAVISTFSEEMAMYSTPAIEGIIRQAMQDDTGVSLDTYLIDSTAESATRPAGLLNGVTPLTATASGTATEKAVADLKQLVAAIQTAGGGSDIVFIMNPAQALGLGLAATTTGDFLFGSAESAAARFGASVITSTTVTAGTVIAVDAAEFATATGDSPRFAVSNEATLHEEDTTPLALSAAGSPNTVAAPMRSLFQTDTVAIRMSLYVTWKMRRTGMVQTVASVGW